MRPCARRHASSSKAAAYRDTNKAIRRNAERAVKPLRMRAAEKEVVVDDRPASCPRCVRRLRIFGQQDELRVDREDAEAAPVRFKWRARVSAGGFIGGFADPGAMARRRRP